MAYKTMNLENPVQLYLQALFTRGEILSLLGKYDRANSDFNAILKQNDVPADIRVNTVVQQAYIAGIRSDFKKPIRELNKALEFSVSIGYKLGEARILLEIAFWEYRMGDAAPALAKINRSLSLIDSMKEDRIILELSSQAMSTLGACYMKMSRFQEGIESFNKGIAYDERLSDKFAKAKKQNNLALLYRNIGDYEIGIELLEKAYKIFMELDYPLYGASAIVNIGLINYHKKEYDLSLEYLKKGISIAKEYSYSSILATAFGHVGNVNFDKGEINIAIKCYNDSLKISREKGFKLTIAKMQGNLVSCYIALDDYSRAGKYLGYAREFYEKINDMRGLAILQGHELDMMIEENAESVEDELIKWEESIKTNNYRFLEEKLEDIKRKFRERRGIK